MSFQYSAIGDNTPENREHLEKIGFTMSMVTMDKALYVKTQNNGKYYETNKDDWSEVIVDCIGNPALFQAVTAMREDSDKDQWFYNEFGEWDLCKVDHLKFNDTHISGKRVWFKANLSEIQAHFKRV